MCSDPHACSSGGLRAQRARITLCIGFFARLGFLPVFGPNRDSVMPSLPAYPSYVTVTRGVATLITLLSAELNVNHRPINDHGNSWGFDAVMHLEIGEVTA